MRTRNSWIVLCVATVAVAHSLFMPIVAETTSCQSSPAEINKQVDVTFTLPEDANQTKRNFIVYHYNDHKFRETVLRCSWQDDRPYCHVARGYNFGWKITENVVVNIPSLSTDQTGLYACQLAGYDVENIKPCRVAVRKAADFQCWRKANTFFCQHGLEDSFESGVARNFTLSMPSLSADKVTEYFCSQSRSQEPSKTKETKQGTTCNIRPWMSMTDASLTCNFQADVYQQKKNVAVYHYTETSFPEIVANCTWVKNDVSCITKPGYSWNKLPEKNHLTFSVPWTHEAQTAMFACQVYGYTAEQTESCGGVTFRDELKAQAALSSDTDSANCNQTSSREQTSTEKIASVLKGSGGPTLNNQFAASDVSAVCSPPHAAVGQQAAVVCRFGEVIEANNFLILHYRPNNTGVPDFPLMCFWMRGELGCEASQDYAYEIILDNHTVILRLPHVTSEHLGTYTCKAVTSHAGHGSCTLALPKAESEDSNDFVGGYNVFISAAAAGLISAAVTVIICAFIMYKRGYRRYAHPQRKPDADNDSYRKLPTRRYYKNNRTAEGNTSYEEIRYSPPPQRFADDAIPVEAAEAAISVRESDASTLPEDVPPPVNIRDGMSEQQNREQVPSKHGPPVVQASSGNKTWRHDRRENCLRHDDVTTPAGKSNAYIQPLEIACGNVSFRMDGSCTEEVKQSITRGPVNAFLHTEVPSVGGVKEMHQDRPERGLEPSEMSSPGPSGILPTTRSGSRGDQQNSPPDQAEYYLHPMHDTRYNSSQESLDQSHDPKTNAEKDARRQVEDLSGDYLQPVNVAFDTSAQPASSCRFNQSYPPGNYRPVYENNVEGL